MSILVKLVYILKVQTAFLSFEMQNISFYVYL